MEKVTVAKLPKFVCYFLIIRSINLSLKKSRDNSSSAQYVECALKLYDKEKTEKIKSCFNAFFCFKDLIFILR